MKPVLKVAIVAGGYILSFFTAWAAVALHDALTDPSSAQASGGMSAFSDVVLFVVVFAAAAVVPTGVGIFFIFGKKKG